MSLLQKFAVKWQGVGFDSIHIWKRKMAKLLYRFQRLHLGVFHVHARLKLNRHVAMATRVNYESLKKKKKKSRGENFQSNCVNPTEGAVAQFQMRTRWTEWLSVRSYRLAFSSDFSRTLKPKRKLWHCFCMSESLMSPAAANITSMLNKQGKWYLGRSSKTGPGIWVTHLNCLLLLRTTWYF